MNDAENTENYTNPFINGWQKLTIKYSVKITTLSINQLHI